MRRYRRQGFYGRESKAWKTFYTNKEGKIVFDRGKKSYNEVRQTVKKNQVKRKDDIINKKMSIAVGTSINTRRKWQNETDKLLKKKRLSADEKIKLKDLSEKSGYKKKQVSRKTSKAVKKIEKKPFNYIQMDILCTFHSTTSTQFYIADESYRRLKLAVKKIAKEADRLNVEFEGMEGNILKTAFRSEQDFNDNLSDVIEGYGEIPFSRGKYKIKIKGIKR